MPLAWFWIRKWQLALIGCVLFIPVSGYVAISFARHPVAIQAKDFFFLIPAYLGFAVFLKRKVRFSGIPRGFTLAVVALIGIVIFQLANPHPRSTEFTAKILGIKIWLFYLPLVMISYVFASTPDRFCEQLWLVVGFPQSAVYFSSS